MVIERIADRSRILSTTINDLLRQMRQHGAPVRIESNDETYYVLRVDQLWALLESPTTLTESEEFTAQEFDLTEEDIAAYQQRQSFRRSQIDVIRQAALDPALEHRLEHARYNPRLSSKVDIEQLLQELEAAMLRNLQTAPLTSLAQ